MDDKVLLTAKEVAAKLGYAHSHFLSTVRYWPQIPKPLDLPGQARWSRAEIEEWAKQHARAA